MSRKMIFGRYDYAAFSTFIAYASGSIAIPVALVQIARALHFPLDAGGTSLGGWLHMVRSIALCASMIMCGFVAGRWGNRRPLGYSVLLIGVGMLLCAASPTFGFLLFALVIAGLGEGVVEGLATPFVQELHAGESGRYVNFTHGFWSLGVLISTLVFGFLLYVGVSWRIVLLLAAGFAILPTALLLMPEKKHRYPERLERHTVKHVIRQSTDIFRVPKFWLYFGAIFLGGGGEFCLTFWCASFIQLEFAASAMAGGIGTASFAAGMFAGRTAFGFLLHQRHLKGLLVVTGVAATLISLAVPQLPRLVTPDAQWVLPALFGILFLSGIAVAPFWPSIQTLAVDRMPKQDATMIYVLLSCAGVPGCGFFTLLMGYVGKYAGLTPSFYLVPACFIVMVALLLVDRKRRE